MGLPQRSPTALAPLAETLQRLVLAPGLSERLLPSSPDGSRRNVLEAFVGEGRVAGWRHRVASRDRRDSRSSRPDRRTGPRSDRRRGVDHRAGGRGVPCGARASGRQPHGLDMSLRTPGRKAGSIDLSARSQRIGVRVLDPFHLGNHARDRASVPMSSAAGGPHRPEPPTRAPAPDILEDPGGAQLLQLEPPWRCRPPCATSWSPTSSAPAANAPRRSGVTRTAAAPRRRGRPRLCATLSSRAG
jgi:hypothetical protein